MWLTWDCNAMTSTYCCLCLIKTCHWRETVMQWRAHTVACVWLKHVTDVRRETVMQWRAHTVACVWLKHVTYVRLLLLCILLQCNSGKCISSMSCLISMSSLQCGKACVHSGGIKFFTHRIPKIQGTYDNHYTAGFKKTFFTNWPGVDLSQFVKSERLTWTEHLCDMTWINIYALCNNTHRVW